MPKIYEYLVWFFSFMQMNIYQSMLLKIIMSKLYDNKKRIVDFETFLRSHSHPQFNKYKETENFKKFQIENGNVVWGRDWDMIFPVYDYIKVKLIKANKDK